MKPPVSIKSKVLELRRSSSLREVAEQTGLPLGTVKTICSRSGAFRDNQKHRNLFTLPMIEPSTGAELALPEQQPQSVVTGDSDLDAVLWLREVIKTGRAVLIDKAMQAAQRIKTPLKELEKRYSDYLMKKSPGNFMAALASFGFADLDALAQRSIQKLALQTEATARFGKHLFADTPAEHFCMDALMGLKLDKMQSFNEGQVDKRFQAHPDLMPNTLGDCLHELAYWHELYLLRHAHDGGDQGREAYARECFVFRCLSHIRPKTKQESIAVFRYLADSERMDDTETNAILLNLIG